MRTKAIAIRALVGHELVARVRKDAGAVGLELLARPTGVEVTRTGLIAERQDYRFFYDILTLNLGRGYFTTDRFKEGPSVYSDASRSKKYTGGGWCSDLGRLTSQKTSTSIVANIAMMSRRGRARRGS